MNAHVVNDALLPMRDQSACEDALRLKCIIRRGPMTRFQLGAIAVCVALNMLDGFDVLVMAFTAPGVSAQWGLSGSQLGVLLSAGLVGMAAGSLIVAPRADRFGRRHIVLMCIVVVCTGMLLSSFSRSLFELAILRVITGLGIGGILPTVNVLVSEYASDKWRNSMVSIYAAGYPIGATVGGAVANILIKHYGWRSAFTFGAVASALMIPVVIRQLPDSLDFILSKRPRNALFKLNQVLRRMSRPQVDKLPDRTITVSPLRPGVRTLLSAGAWRKTLLVSIAFFTVMATLYFVNSWMPKLLTSGGMSAQRGITGGILFNLGGLVGTLGFGFLCAYADLRRVTLMFLLFAALSLGLCGHLFSSPTAATTTTAAAAFSLAILIGGSINGAVAGLYALTAGLYTTEVRSTGMGWALGVGRVGAILSPLLVGVLIDHRWHSSHLYFLFVVPLLIALWAVFGIRQTELLGGKG
jgi:benzoate transport